MIRPPLGAVLATGALAVGLMGATIASPTVPGSDVATPSLPSRGESLVQAKGCTGCHTIGGVSGIAVGPDLRSLRLVAGTRVPGLSAEAYVRQSVRDPGVYVVPGYREVSMPDLGLSAEEVDTVVAFLLAPG